MMYAEQACGLSAPRRSSPRNGSNVDRWSRVSTRLHAGVICSLRGRGVGGIGGVVFRRAIVAGAGLLAILLGRFGGGDLFLRKFLRRHGGRSDLGLLDVVEALLLGGHVV